MRGKEKRDKVRLMNVLSNVERMGLVWLCERKEDVECLLREEMIEWDPSEDLFRLTDKGERRPGTKDDDRGSAYHGGP